MDARIEIQNQINALNKQIEFAEKTAQGSLLVSLHDRLTVAIQVLAQMDGKL